MLPQSRVTNFAYPRKLRHQHSTYQIESNQSPTENIDLDNIRKGDTTIRRKYKRTWNGQSLKDRKPNYIVWLIPVLWHTFLTLHSLGDTILTFILGNHVVQVIQINTHN